MYQRLLFAAPSSINWKLTARRPARFGFGFLDPTAVYSSIKFTSAEVGKQLDPQSAAGEPCSRFMSLSHSDRPFQLLVHINFQDV